MKKNKKNIILILSLVCISFTLLSCRNVGKYADDVINGRKSIKIKRAPKQKQCGTCHGSGNVYIYGNWYECSNCGGDGKVWID